MSSLNPYEAPSVDPNTPDGGPKPLGSLAQSARGKELKTAQWILVVLGALGILVGGFFIMVAEPLVDEQIRQNPGGMAPAANRETQIIELRAGFAGIAVIGLVYILFGVFLRKAPVPITTASLALFLADFGYLAWVNPIAFVQGIVFEIIVVVILIRAIMTAFAYRGQARAERDFA